MWASLWGKVAISPFPFSLPPLNLLWASPWPYASCLLHPSCPSCCYPGHFLEPRNPPMAQPCFCYPGPFPPPPPADSALSHSPWQPCFRPQEASRASEGPLSPSGAGQMEARLCSNNHGNRWVGKSWHFELASGTKGWHTAEPRGETVPSQDQSPQTPFQKEHSDIQRS